MLYDPKWETKIDTRPSLIGLIAWLENKPPHETYDYRCAGMCLMAQYLLSCGIKEYSLYSNEVAAFFGADENETNPAVGHPWTYGAALKRCREWQITR